MANDEEHKDQHVPVSEQPVGQWPRKTPNSAVLLTGLLWALWFVFLVWMMVLRLQTTPV